MVPHGSDIAAAMIIAREVAASDPRVIGDPPPFIGVAQIESTGIRLGVNPWVQVADVVATEAGLYQSLEARFRAAGIGVPLSRHEVRVLDRG